MKNLHFLFFILLMMVGSWSYGQTFYTEYPLKNPGQTPPEIKKEFARFLETSRQIMFQTPDSTYARISKEYQEVRRSKNPEAKAFFQTMLGDIYKIKGNYAISTRYYYNALAWYSANNDTMKIVSVMISIAELNRALGEYGQALEILGAAQNLYEQNLHDQHLLSAIQATKAAIYFEIFSLGSKTIITFNYGKILPDSSFKTIDKHAIEGFLDNIRSSYHTANETGDTLLMIKDFNLLGKYHFLQKKI